MSAFLPFSPLRTPHIKQAHAASDSSDDQNIVKPGRHKMPGIVSKKPSSPMKTKPKSHSGQVEYNSEGKTKKTKGKTLDKSPKKNVKGTAKKSGNEPPKKSAHLDMIDDEIGSDSSLFSSDSETPHVSVPTSNPESDDSDTERQIDRGLLHIAKNIRSKLHLNRESDNESEVIPNMNSKLVSPHKKVPGSPTTKKVRSPKKMVVSPKKKLPQVSEPEHALSVSEDSDESINEEVHCRIPKLRNPPPAEYVPVDFKEYKPEVFAEETRSSDVELVLITVPFGLDITSLENKRLVLNGTEKLQTDKDGVIWKSHSRKVHKEDETHEFMPLMPSRKSGHLVPVKPFSHHVTFTASYEIPPLLPPVIPPEPDFEVPKGLKYRNEPFGCGKVDAALPPALSKKRKHDKEDKNEDAVLSPSPSKKKKDHNKVKEESEDDVLSPSPSKKKKDRNKVMEESEDAVLSPSRSKRKKDRNKVMEESEDAVLSPSPSKKKKDHNKVKEESEDDVLSPSPSKKKKDRNKVMEESEDAVLSPSRSKRKKDRNKVMEESEDAVLSPSGSKKKKDHNKVKEESEDAVLSPSRSKKKKDHNKVEEESEVETKQRKKKKHKQKDKKNRK